VFEPAAFLRQRKRGFRRAGVFGVLKQLEYEVRLIWIKVFEDIEVDVTFICVKPVEKLTPLFH
jgi:hypothetical protein